ITTPDVGSPNFQLCLFFTGDPWDIFYWHFDDIICPWESSANGNLSGEVIDLEFGFPIADAAVTIAGITEYTLADGTYLIENIPVGNDYTVTCDASDQGYNVAYGIVSIFEDETTICDFTLTSPTMDIEPLSIVETLLLGDSLETNITISNNGNGPLDWTANVQQTTMFMTDYSLFTGGTLIAKYDIEPENTEPGGLQTENTRDEVIIHWDGVNYNGIGLVEGGAFVVAARFATEDLIDYYEDYDLVGVQLYAYDPSFTNITLKIWEGGSFGNPGTEVYSENITGQVNPETWTNYILEIPIELVVNNEYWIGYSVEHPAEGYPAGCDAGPAVDGKGDWISLDGVSWDELQDFGLDYNWNIRGVLSSGPMWITVEPSFGTIAATFSEDVTVKLFSTEVDSPGIYTANIIFSSDPDVGTTTVPVTLTVTGVGVEDIPILATKLNSNYPNPFNPDNLGTIISFSLKEKSHVKLSIYNIKGQLVDRLIDDEMNPVADYKVVWNGNKDDKTLANGIYFYKLDADNKTFIRKMILMR
ncbi:MAG: T9SS type A sorting domain-containing protein, partial [Candidatus Cloacimonetes bacterium]|nr:T9SS type A sorting domain-containing protein [Candidatus Cloacimonadota bacterium]